MIGRWVKETDDGINDIVGAINFQNLIDHGKKSPVRMLVRYSTMTEMGIPTMPGRFNESWQQITAMVVVTSVVVAPMVITTMVVASMNATTMGLARKESCWSSKGDVETCGQKKRKIDDWMHFVGWIRFVFSVTIVVKSVESVVFFVDRRKK